MNGQGTDLVWLFYDAMLKSTKPLDTTNKVRTYFMNVQRVKEAKEKNGTTQIYFRYKNVNYFKHENTLPHTWPNYPRKAQAPTTKLTTEITSEP